MKKHIKLGLMTALLLGTLPVQAQTKKSAHSSQVSALKAKVMQEQKAYMKTGRIEVWDNHTGTLKKGPGPRYYLSFSSDYSNPKENRIAFNGKEFIYAHLNLTKPLTSMLPGPNTPGLQYYRVSLKATVNGRSQENANKIQRKVDFTLGHNTKILPLAVIPEKAFFEDLLAPYRKGETFPNAAAEDKGLRDLLARNFSRQMSYLFKDLAPGEHQVDMVFSVTAKLAGSKYFSLKNMKGTFLLNMDQDAKERYNNTFNMLTKLYRDYEAQRSIAEQSIEMDREKEMLAKMTPRQRERFQIAKRSPLGYMAAYGGPKANIRFGFGKLRKKNAYIDIVWPEGSCSKCEAGTSSVMVTHRSPRSVPVPLGAKVSLNGKVLIPKVTQDKSVTLYWYY